MPHLVLEYSDNIKFDTQPLLSRLHNALVATGAVNLKGLKSRAIKHTEYRIADGDPGYAFVHLNLLIRAGPSFGNTARDSQTGYDRVRGNLWLLL